MAVLLMCARFYSFLRFKIVITTSIILLFVKQIMSSIVIFLIRYKKNLFNTFWLGFCMPKIIFFLFLKIVFMCKIFLCIYYILSMDRNLARDDHMQIGLQRTKPYTVIIWLIFTLVKKLNKWRQFDVDQHFVIFHMVLIIWKQSYLQLWTIHFSNL